MDRLLAQLRVVVLACVAAACLANAAPASAGSPSGGEIRVSGSTLVKDGVPWVPRGVQIVGLVAPHGSLRGRYAAAAAHFGASELSAVASSHADLVRIQVSEFGLDPRDPLYAPGYLQEVEDAVRTARSLGLEVIVSLQAEPQAGKTGRCPLPDAGAERAWTELAPMFAADEGVMFELYNEPAVGATRRGWHKWLVGGVVRDARGACRAIGMQTLVDDIRANGADNVIIVPGLKGEQTLARMPAVLDPANRLKPQLAYGIHYPSARRRSPVWDREFGNASGSVPVIVTEWDLNSAANCVPGAPAEAQLLLDYLASKRIGIVGFAFDIPGTIVADWSYRPTSYSNFTCGVPGGGPGELLFGEFAASARADAMPSHGSMAARIVSAQYLERLKIRSPEVVQTAFDSPRTFVTGGGRPLLDRLSASEAIPTATFTDERRLAAAVRARILPEGTRAVIYEDENRGVTPRAQQLHPAAYYRAAARVAHRHRLLLIASPALDLVDVLAPGTRPGRRYAEFLRLGIAAAAARFADVYEIRTQVTGKYAGFVRAARAQARAARPGIEVLAGLRL